MKSRKRHTAGEIELTKLERVRKLEGKLHVLRSPMLKRCPPPIPGNRPH